MTAIYENEGIVREVQKRKLVKRVCDRCGVEIKKKGYTAKRAFRLCFIEERFLEDGAHYRVGWRVDDLCDNCVGLLKQWLEDNNIALDERTMADAPNLGFTCSDDTKNLL